MNSMPQFRGFYATALYCGLVSLLTVFEASSSVYSPLDYKVVSTDNFNIQDDTYAGFMPMGLDDSENADGSLFFWLAKRRIDPHQKLAGDNGEEKLLIWLNGGPGCSSMVGMMWENGPFSLKDGESAGSYDFPVNPFSWNEAAHVLFVEQPVRTGFSVAANHSRTIRNEKEVAEDFYMFLTSFLQVFPELARSKVFISGESFAGSYIPSIAEYIVRNQLHPKTSNLPYIDLQGVAIGNGVIDDAIQTASYTEYAYSHGLIPLAAKTLIDDIYTRCVENAASHTRTVDSDPDECEVMSLVLKAAGNPNEYDTATFNGYDHIIKPDGVFNKFFNDPSVQERLHVRGYNVPGINFVPEDRRKLASNEKPVYYAPPGWSVCNDDINSDMRGNHPQSVVPALQFLVNHIRVLLYNGERDLNTNFLGTLHTLEAHVWSNQRWNEASRSLFQFNGDVAGEHFELGKLSFMIVRNSGHLLPMDIPAPALEMIHRFVNDLSFADVKLPSEQDYLQQLYHLNEQQSRESFVSSYTGFESYAISGVSIVIIGVALFVLFRVGTRYSKGKSASSGGIDTRTWQPYQSIDESSLQ